MLTTGAMRLLAVSLGQQKWYHFKVRCDFLLCWTATTRHRRLGIFPRMKYAFPFPMECSHYRFHWELYIIHTLGIIM